MSEESERSPEATPVAPDDAAEQVARRYIKEHKHWTDEEYELEILKRSDVYIIDAVHRDDLNGSKSPNKSVQLHIDLEASQVVRELAYQ
jgi:hypothetical protein